MELNITPKTITNVATKISLRAEGINYDTQKFNGVYQLSNEDGIIETGAKEIDIEHLNLLKKPLSLEAINLFLSNWGIEAISEVTAESFI